MQDAMGKLSKGTIDNTDDPAGVGISERMRAQIDGVQMARQNTDNAVSLVQTADSWLQKVNDQLSRMRQLAIEADSGIVSASDKDNIQLEYKAMQDEIVRITSRYTAAGKFNDLFLFRGGNGVGSATGDSIESSSPITIQIGTDVDQTIQLDLANLEVTNTAVIGTVSTYTYNTNNTVATSTHTSVSWSSVIDSNMTSASSADVIGKLDAAINYVASSRAQMAAQQNRLEQTSSGLLTYEDNLRAAESKIRDVDMARESTNFAKYQVMTNAANAMLAQANQLPSSVLQLLQ
jgi:flagellin